MEIKWNFAESVNNKLMTSCSDTDTFTQHHVLLCRVACVIFMTPLRSLFNYSLNETFLCVGTYVDSEISLIFGTTDKVGMLKRDKHSAVIVFYIYFWERFSNTHWTFGATDCFFL